MKRTIVALCLFLTATLPVAARQKERITARDLVGMKVPQQLAVSPDGKRVAYVVSEPDFERSRNNLDLYLDDRRLTHTPDYDESRPRFSPDGRTLAFLADRPVPNPGGSDEEPKPQVWLLPVDGGEARPLTSAEEGVIHFEWLPDGKAIVFTTREALPKPEAERRAADKKRKADQNVVDSERYRKEFWRIGLARAKAERIARGDFGVGEFRISPDGTRIVYESNLTGREEDSMKTNLYVLAWKDGSSRQLTKTGGGTTGARWSPDGKRIAYIAYSDPRYEYSRVDAFVIDADGGEPVSVSKAFDRSVVQVEWTRAGGLRLLVADGTRQLVYRAEASGGDPPRPVRWGVELVSEIAPGDGGDFVVAESATSGPEVLGLTGELAEGGVDGPGPVRRFETSLNTDLKNRTPARQDVIRWKGPDNLDIEGILVYPVGYEPGKRYPTITIIHGGPFWRATVTLRSLNWAQLFAANGYAVLLPNFRGSDGYGDAFSQANRGDLGGKDYLDIIAGVDKVIAMGVADPNRLGVSGHSYGGYMTNWIIAKTDRFKGAVSASGIFNFVTDFSNSVYTNWEPEYLGGYYWERDNLRLYLERSPAKHAANIKTPVLIFHGDDDTNTFIANSQEMYQALRLMGRTVEFVRLPREGHEYGEPNHLVEFANRSLAWMDRYVKGATRSEYAVGEYAPAGGWEYSVASVDKDAEYAGRAASGRFVEVTLLLRSTDGAGALELDPSHVSLELHDGKTLRPAGIVTSAAGVSALVTGAARVTAGAPKDGGRAYVPVVVAFDAPRDAARARVRLGSFAVFVVELD